MKRVLALDLGTKTCGIAVSDSLGIPHGREDFHFLEGAYRQCLAHVLALLENEKITEVALGYPLNMDDTIGPSARRSERFKEALLAANPALQVVLVDERLTTVEAHERLSEAALSSKKHASVIDEAAAVLILENYLSKRGDEGK